MTCQFSPGGNKLPEKRYSRAGQRIKPEQRPPNNQTPMKSMLFLNALVVLTLAATQDHQSAAQYQLDFRKRAAGEVWINRYNGESVRRQEK